MIGVPLTFQDIQDAVTSFFNIGATTAILAAVLGLGLIPVIAVALRSLVGRR